MRRPLATKGSALRLFEAPRPTVHASRFGRPKDRRDSAYHDWDNLATLSANPGVDAHVDADRSIRFDRERLRDGTNAFGRAAGSVQDVTAHGQCDVVVTVRARRESVDFGSSVATQNYQRILLVYLGRYERRRRVYQFDGAQWSYAE